jgi:uncharacterized Tic20 family protein
MSSGTEDRISYTLTAIFWFFMIAGLMGVASALFGTQRPTQFNATFMGASVSTVDVGLAVFAVCAIILLIITVAALRKGDSGQIGLMTTVRK